MAIYVNQNGNNKKVSQIFHNDGTGIKEVKELYTNNNGNIIKVFSNRNYNTMWTIFDTSSSAVSIVPQYKLNNKIDFFIPFNLNTSNSNYNIFSFVILADIDFTLKKGDKIIINYDLDIKANSEEGDSSYLTLKLATSSNKQILNASTDVFQDSSNSIEGISNYDGRLKFGLSLECPGNSSSNIYFKTLELLINNNRIF